MAKSNARNNTKTGSKTQKSGKKGGTWSSKSVLVSLVLFLIILAIYVFNEGGGLSVFDEAPDHAGMSKPLLEINYEDDAIPTRVEENGRRRSSDNDCQYLRRKAYRAMFNKHYRVPEWVAYELTLAETLGNRPRLNDFFEDSDLGSRGSRLSDYRGSGYDRGHMAPSADMNWDDETLHEAYLLSNMCPQIHGLNAGTWNDLEQQIRRWTERDSALYVVCGPVLPRERISDYNSIGNGHVFVPEYFYKVVLSVFGKQARAIGFVMPNRAIYDDFMNYAVSVDSVQRMTGLDFWPILPDEIETRVESSFESRDWR